MRYWLLKSEPFKYPYHQLEADGQTLWDGVRNYQARNYLREMMPGDLALFYHSNEGKEVVAIAKISSTALPDPTAPDEDWSVVEVQPFARLPKPVALASLRQDPLLSGMAIFRQMRLSVVPVTDEEYKRILELGDYQGVEAAGR